MTARIIRIRRRLKLKLTRLTREGLAVPRDRRRRNQNMATSTTMTTGDEAETWTRDPAKTKACLQGKTIRRTKQNSSLEVAKMTLVLYDVLRPNRQYHPIASGCIRTIAMTNACRRSVAASVTSFKDAILPLSVTIGRDRVEFDAIDVARWTMVRKTLALRDETSAAMITSSRATTVQLMDAARITNITLDDTHGSAEVAIVIAVNSF